MAILNRFARWRNWYRDTGKTCLGGGMLCPSASSSITDYFFFYLKCSALLVWRQEQHPISKILKFCFWIISNSEKPDWQTKQNAIILRWSTFLSILSALSISDETIPWLTRGAQLLATYASFSNLGEHLSKQASNQAGILLFIKEWKTHNSAQYYKSSMTSVAFQSDEF